MKSMTSIMFSFALVACAPLTRTVVVDRATAQSYGPRTEVLAIVRDGVEIPPNDTSAHEHDQLKVRAQFAPGMRIPGEGVVHTRASVPMLIVGGLLVGLGIFATAGMAGFCANPGGVFDTPAPDVSERCTVETTVLSALLFGLPGTVLLVSGASAITYVDRAPAVRLTPIITHDSASLGLTAHW